MKQTQSILISGLLLLAFTVTVAYSQTVPTPVPKPAPVDNSAVPVMDWPALGRYAENDRVLRREPAVPGRVVFMGDSITEGWAKQPHGLFDGRLYIGRGISGQTTPQMLLRFRPDVLEVKAETVVILAGTNDIAGNTGEESLETIEGNIASMAELGQAHKIRVVISSILPALDYSWRPHREPAEKIRTINRWLEAYCSMHGFIFLNYYPAFATPEGGMKPEYSHDGVHPTPEGFALMEKMVKQALAQ
jgi:lysophospholipase L1-like esterase